MFMDMDTDTGWWYDMINLETLEFGYGNATKKNIVILYCVYFKIKIKNANKS